MEFSKKAKESFITGILGKVYKEDFLDKQLEMINISKASESFVTCTFDQGAKEDDACIQVVLRVVKKSVLEEEEQV
jgi:hypothetical protein